MAWQIILGMFGAYGMGQAAYGIGQIFAQPDGCDTKGVCNV
jgi:hypothetical protein